MIELAKEYKRKLEEKKQGRSATDRWERSVVKEMITQIEKPEALNKDYRTGDDPSSYQY